MGLRSPYGNGPQDISNPVPQTNVPAPAPAAPVRAPAAAPAQPSAPPPSQSPDLVSAFDPVKEQQDLVSGFNPGDQMLVGGSNSPVSDFMQHHFGAIRQKTDGKREVRVGDKWHELSDGEWSALQKVGNFAAEFTKMAGAVGGGIGGEAVTGGNPVGGFAGGTAGYALGASLVESAKLALGIPSEEKRNALMFHLGNLAEGGLASIAGQGTGRFLEQTAGQFAGKAALATEANAAAQGTIKTAAQAGVTDLLSHQTAPDTAAGSAEGAMAQKIANGNLGPQPQSELLSHQSAQEAKVMDAWNNVKDSFADKSRAVFENGVSSQEAFKPHEALADYLDSMRSKIGTYKKEVYNYAGDARVDASPLMSDFKSTLGPLIDDHGNLNKDILKLDTESGRQLAKNYVILQNAISRDAGAFSESGAQGRVDPLNKTFTGRTGDPSEFAPTADPGSLGPVSSGDIAMKKTREGSPLKDSYMAPNDAGNAQSGIPIRQLDKLVDSLQDYWKDAVNRGDANAGKFGFLARRANELYYQGLDKEVASKAPEAKQAVDLLRRYNGQYSKMVDNYTTLTDGLSSNPMFAARQLLDSKSPDEAQMLFHALPQAQADGLRRTFIDALEQRATGDVPGRLFDAKAVKRDLAKYPDDMLDTIFMGKAAQIKSILDTAANLQRVKVDPQMGPPKAMAQDIAKKISDLPYPWYEKAVDFFRGNQPLYKYLSKPDFIDQVTRYGKLKTATSGLGKASGIAGKAVQAGAILGGDKVRGEY